MRKLGNFVVGMRTYLKLLVVNEKESYCELLKDFVELNSHLYEIEYQFANSGQQGLRLVGEWSPSVILLDAHLSDLNSFSFLEKCRGSAAPIIITSAHSSQEIEASALRQGAAGYFVATEDYDGLDCLLEHIVELASEPSCAH